MRTHYRNTQGTIESRGERDADGCLLWPDCTVRGYGMVGWGGKSVSVHRLVYEWHHGPIPEGHSIDHLCHNEDPSCQGGPTCKHRRCMEPSHLAAKPPEQNRRDAMSSREFCRNGHPTAEFRRRVSTTGEAYCIACNRITNARRRARA